MLETCVPLEVRCTETVMTMGVSNAAVLPTVVAIFLFTSCLAFEWPAHVDQLGNNLPFCGTQHVFDYKRALNLTKPPSLQLQSGCLAEGPCDDPTVRNEADTSMLIFNLIFNIFCSSEGQCPDGVDETLVNSAVETLRNRYNPYNLDFLILSINFWFDDTYFCLPPYSNDPEWLFALLQMKETYAQNPSKAVNVFVSCQDQGTMGTLLGIGTFPWDEEALSPTGGLWLNSITISEAGQEDGDTTLEHELGHNFGLWHTFHGVSEVQNCQDPCYEEVHEINEEEFDLVGDFCADTLSTPLNYYCYGPDGTDCFGNDWGPTSYNNIMGYSYIPVACATGLTDSQVYRSHCWICSAISSQLAEGC